jgi:hypothetical protein
VVVLSGFNCSGRSNCIPLAEAISTTAVRSSGSHAKPAATSMSGSGPITVAGIHRPLEAAIRAAAVPSPPSAIGLMTIRAPGAALPMASATIRQARSAARVPLNESIATTIFIAHPACRASSNPSQNGERASSLRRPTCFDWLCFHDSILIFSPKTPKLALFRTSRPYLVARRSSLVSRISFCEPGRN